MAWITEYRGAGAGQLKAFLDSIITNYGQEGGYGWSIADAEAGDNIGVYKCQPDDASSFVLVVKDNQADYATIEYWEGWDAVAHAGTGLSMTYGFNDNYTLRVRKVVGVYGAAINKQRIVLCMLAAGLGYYLGYPRRFDESKNTPLFIGTNANTSGTGYPQCSLCSADGAATNYAIDWRWFKDSVGNVNKVAASWGAALGSINYYGRWETWTTIGKLCIQETMVQEGEAPFKLIGVLDGVMGCAKSPSGRANGDTIIVGDEVWLVLVGANNTTALVKEA